MILFSEPLVKRLFLYCTREGFLTTKPSLFHLFSFLKSHFGRHFLMSIINANSTAEESCVRKSELGCLF